MSEFFTRPPEIPEEELSRPRVVPPGSALARTISTILMLIWACWWWNDLDGGAYWIIIAAAIFATGEAMPHLYNPFLPLWRPLSFVVRPVTALLVGLARLLIPEAYRKPQQVLKPLSFKQINRAIDEEKARREGRPPPPPEH